MSPPDPTAPYGQPEPTPQDHTVPDRPAERFVPGTLLAGRYRVVTPLGRGGMGEVYRADDLTLGQPVALKFLPPCLSHDPDRLARLRKEVATARLVSHPNACRVYDIAGHEGQSFLTMEFIDGEDLASLLKRIGRLSEEKGVEIARQLCAALAAVHDQGLLHRDLKPANVMLDGRGKVRLTDFGLAAAAAELGAAQARQGTPLYMAPEQAAGREVTTRTDLYSLGLILYELFTGRRTFPGANRDTPPSKLGSHVTSLDPAVEAVVLQCLEPDPADRPRSAVEVLLRLPGADPLAVALAAGETPSPRVVANAAVEGSLRPAVAAGLAAAAGLGAALCGWMNGLSLVSNRTPLRDAEPAVMRYKARAVMADLGHSDPAGDSADRYFTDADCLRYVHANDPSPGRWDFLAGGRPPAIFFFYRVAREPLAPLNMQDGHGMVPYLRVGMQNPPPLAPGMADVSLDLRGRLIRFHKVADFLAPTRQSSAAAPDWRPAFDAAGLDYEAFAARPAAPRHRPVLASDSRFAWEGPYPDRLVDHVRVEAAALGGEPVYFAVEFPWHAETHAGAYPEDKTLKSARVWLLLAYGLPLVALGLAWWNWRGGRADVRGAAKLGGGVFLLGFAIWLLEVRHLPDDREVHVLEIGLGVVALDVILFAALYLALEPVVRKRWPWRLVGWSRLLEGKVRDPLVARDALVGLAVGVGVALAMSLSWTYPLWPTDRPIPQWFVDVQPSPPTATLMPIRHGMTVGLLWFFVIFVVHWVCRNRSLGIAIVTLVPLGLYLPQDTNPASAALTIVACSIGVQLVALRYGLLAVAAAFAAQAWLVYTNWTLDVRAWFAAGPNLAVALLAAAAAYCAYTASLARNNSAE